MLTLWQQKLFFLWAQLIHGSFNACWVGAYAMGWHPHAEKWDRDYTHKHRGHLAAFACIMSNLSVQIERQIQTSALCSYWLPQCSQRLLTVNGHECDLMPGWAFPLVFHLRFKVLVKFRKYSFYLIGIVCVSVLLTPLDLSCYAGMIMTRVLGWIFSAG